MFIGVVFRLFVCVFPCLRVEDRLWPESTIIMEKKCIPPERIHRVLDARELG